MCLANAHQTLGFEFGSKLIDIPRLVRKLRSWDTAGTECIMHSYCRGDAGSGGCLLVYAANSRGSFEDARNRFAGADTHSSRILWGVLQGEHLLLVKFVCHASPSHLLAAEEGLLLEAQMQGVQRQANETTGLHAPWTAQVWILRESVLVLSLMLTSPDPSIAISHLSGSTSLGSPCYSRVLVSNSPAAIADTFQGLLRRSYIRVNSSDNGCAAP
ncbi:hypothetical protein B0H17DRAFT_1209835 [Mycena rosella]|uniref:Uncharacterized protein n=1 Tax=Mycena rosella TaxID=1033263 RepID=A0AAD7G5P2_MYCRO|nr:hypothetical protein B0H17DRAFT_1209835 [Mycena rosella]